MAKQKGRKVAAAAARAAKDRQFKALQKGIGILSDKEEDEGEEVELVLSTPPEGRYMAPGHKVSAAA
jgi:hypothetical protein